MCYNGSIVQTPAKIEACRSTHCCNAGENYKEVNVQNLDKKENSILKNYKELWHKEIMVVIVENKVQEMFR